MVEFDVMLSKDRVPLVFHNFKTSILAERPGLDRRVPIKIPIKDLTSAQIRALRHEFETTPRNGLREYIQRHLPEIIALGKLTPQPDANDNAAYLAYAFFVVIRSL